MEVTGEILHGKTSPLRHDSKGVYAGLPQNLPVTRYHSLAGTHATIPDCLEVSSWISSGPDGGKGIIMGVRHREMLVEGVQFHPESILTAEGRIMLRNFLKLQGGTWSENERLGRSAFQIRNGQSSKLTNGASLEKETILEKIYKHRRAAIKSRKGIPSMRSSDLQASFELGLSPPVISFSQRLRLSPFKLSLCAEIKRASPSKGEIAMSICAPAQAREYAKAGASVISVLTEPEWFKGSMGDLRDVRQSLEGLPNRPAVLCKDFIFDKYQILEARLAGADTVLLIVKMLSWTNLEALYHFCKDLGMEPLVEVNNVEEMGLAIQLKAEVIGINNRDLTNFNVDLNTTSRLMNMVPSDALVCALSGISGSQDVQPYLSNGVRAVLVGEALMRAQDVSLFTSDLLGGSFDKRQNPDPGNMLVKICGTRSVEAARCAVDSGADMIGIIMVEGRKRFVPNQVALAISKEVHKRRPIEFNQAEYLTNRHTTLEGDYFDHWTQNLTRPDRPLLVGVFQNQPLPHILAQQQLLQLDAVQLHGSEPIEWASLIPVPVIRRFGLRDYDVSKRGYHALPLLDAHAGGTGQSLDTGQVRKLLSSDPGLRVILAGGLNPDNVASTLAELQDRSASVVAVDVSSGVESEGVQSLDKITAFIKAAKTALLSKRSGDLRPNA